MMGKRDYQRQRVYDAEYNLKLTSTQIPTQDGCQDYIDKILRSRWWKSRCALTEVNVVRGRGYTYFGGWDYKRQAWEIQCPFYFKNNTPVSILLHELVHIYLAYEARQTSLPLVVFYDRQSSHGRKFARELLRFIHRWLGKESAEELRKGYRTYKVKYYPPRNGHGSK